MLLRDPSQRLYSAFSENMRVETNHGTGWNNNMVNLVRKKLSSIKDPVQKFDEYVRFQSSDPNAKCEHHCLQACQTKMVRHTS